MEPGEAERDVHAACRERIATLEAIVAAQQKLIEEQARLLQSGTRCGEPKTEGMCVMILKLAPALWTFARIEGVEPTNNTAERTVRPAVLYRKGCFGTQSAANRRPDARTAMACAGIGRGREPADDRGSQPVVSKSRM